MTARKGAREKNILLLVCSIAFLSAIAGFSPAAAAGFYPTIKDLPQSTEVIKADDNVKAIKAWAHEDGCERLRVVSETLLHEVATLRKALQKTLTGPAFPAEIEKGAMPIDHVIREEVERVVEAALSISPVIENKLQFLVTTKKQE
ncbi:MAG TPA: hypothetical protein VNO43_06500 [Candidatus Eisenbacteria bacterium]|nr:hypothetical protein [Candidatus Eisenbacteria bacterium]